jgi:hypothetical protein
VWTRHPAAEISAPSDQRWPARTCSAPSKLAKHRMQFCAYEDREKDDIGVRLLVTSFAIHNPDLRLRLFYPVADERFCNWIQKFPNVHLDKSLDLRGMGWNCKPKVLLKALEDGAREIVWLDSDLIVTRPIGSIFDGLAEEIVMVSEEALWGRYKDDQAARARAWGFDVGRHLPFTLNTCVLRVTHKHLALVENWGRLLESRTYAAAQELEIPDRPTHLLGDQDVFTALLCREDFGQIPLRFLRRVTCPAFFGPAEV